MSVATEITRIQGAKSDIASAIENKGVTVPSNTKIDEMAALINQIDEDQAADNDVIFIDHEGVILYSYSAAEFAQLTELPPNPIRVGLTAQGWNWTLSDAKSYVAECGGLVIGQNYVTSDGKTHIWVLLDENYHTPYIGVGVNGTVTIEWGEGYSNSTLTGTDATSLKRTLAPYTQGGIYEIKLSLTEGSEYRILGLSVATMLCSLTQGTSNTANKIYSSSIRKIQIGENCTLGDYAFSWCTKLESVSLPLNCLTSKSHIFYITERLKAVVIPPTNAPSGGYFIYSADSLRYASIPSVFGAIGSRFIYRTWGLKKFYLSPSTTSYITYVLYDTLIDKLVIPASVTAFGNASIYECYCLLKIRFLGSTPPTMGGASCFSNLPTTCVISVPTGSLSAYTSAANYPDPNTYTYIEE